MSGVPPLGCDVFRDPLDVSRETIVECAQRAGMYANMVMDLATIRDDDGAAVMRSRLIVEMKGMNAAFAALAAGLAGSDPARAAREHFDRDPAPAPRQSSRPAS